MDKRSSINQEKFCNCDKDRAKSNLCRSSQKQSIETSDVKPIPRLKTITREVHIDEIDYFPKKCNCTTRQSPERKVEEKSCVKTKPRPKITSREIQIDEIDYFPKKCVCKTRQSPERKIEGKCNVKAIQRLKTITKEVPLKDIDYFPKLCKCKTRQSYEECNCDGNTINPEIQHNVNETSNEDKDIIVRKSYETCDNERDFDVSKTPECEDTHQLSVQTLPAERTSDGSNQPADYSSISCNEDKPSRSTKRVSYEAQLYAQQSDENLKCSLDEYEMEIPTSSKYHSKSETDEDPYRLRLSVSRHHYESDPAGTSNINNYNTSLGNTRGRCCSCHSDSDSTEYL